MGSKWIPIRLVRPDLPAHPMHVAGNLALCASLYFAMRMLFAAIDEDGDGRLDSGELRRFFLQGRAWRQLSRAQ